MKRLFLTVCFLSNLVLSAQDVHPPLYVKHITKILPNPNLKIGRKYRPTLHWTFLGQNVPMATRSVDQNDGSVTIKPHEDLFSNKKYKYAVIERLDILAPKIVGGGPLDIYTLGEHRPSKEAYILVPENEKGSVDESRYEAQIVYYSGSVEGQIKQVVRRFAQRKKLSSVWHSALGMPAGYYPEEEMSQVLREIVDDLEACQGLQMATQKILAQATKTGIIEEATCSWRECGSRDEGTTIYECAKSVVDKTDFFLFFIKSAHPKFNEDFLQQAHIYQDSNISLVLILENGNTIHFKNLLTSMGVEPNLIGLSHASSGLLTVEVEILKLFSRLNKSGSSYEDNLLLAKQEFDKTLETCLEKIPNKHKEELRRYFENYFARRNLEYEQIFI